MISTHNPAIPHAQKDLAGAVVPKINRRAIGNLRAANAWSLFYHVVVAAEIPEVAQLHGIREIPRKHGGPELSEPFLRTEPDMVRARGPWVLLRCWGDHQVIHGLAIFLPCAPRGVCGARLPLDDPDSRDAR